MRIVYLAFYLRDETASGANIDLYRRAEGAPETCIERAGQGGKWLLLDRERAAVERLLVVHDEQLAVVPKHRFMAAWDRLQSFFVGTGCSPILVRRDKPKGLVEQKGVQMGRSKMQRGRLALTKEMLLPLPANVVREFSLENHLALVSIKGGSGTEDTMIALLRLLYLTWFMVERSLREGDSALFVEAEEALQASIAAARKGAGWSLCDRRVVIVEHLLLRFDQVIDEVPKFRYLEAVERTRRFVASTQLSPLPDTRLIATSC